ncbi:hypothetical protein LR48_Vigan11g078200 [Vigna angularis]|uniref:Uncharacterized protein n=1 Tax=Phaseolus angularis TaxID=3914 RepID=A0A0L9VSL1_PHAAN|nr:hypothetical protein LR48_Vigan11g078200 [Vigna angularis]
MHSFFHNRSDRFVEGWGAEEVSDGGQRWWMVDVGKLRGGDGGGQRCFCRRFRWREEAELWPLTTPLGEEQRNPSLCFTMCEEEE